MSKDAHSVASLSVKIVHLHVYTITETLCAIDDSTHTLPGSQLSK